MMRLRPSLKKLVKPGLLLSLGIPIVIYLSGCLGPREPTYKEKDIPSVVKQICKDEYNLDVITKITPTTLWIYAPLSKMLHTDYGTKEDKIFDEKMTDKLRNILTTIGRVLISADRTPEFFVLLASDINIGLDYAIIGSVVDIKEYYAGFIPWPEAIGDTEGRHFRAYDIKLADFLAEQIAQRIAMQFQEEGLKKYFKVDKSVARFNNDRFIFEYAIRQTLKPDKKINLIKEILGVISYCIKTYEFKDFSYVEIKDLLTQDKLILNKEEIYRGSIT